MLHPLLVQALVYLSITSNLVTLDVFSFTEGTRPRGVSFNENDRSSIDLNSFDL